MPDEITLSLVVTNRPTFAAALREAAAALGPPMQQAEPSPPNRWAAFTDDELEEFIDSFGWANQARGYHTDEEKQFEAEIEDEQWRRRKA